MFIFIKYFCSVIFINYKEKEKENKNITVCTVEWEPTQNTGSGWFRKIWGVDQPTFISIFGGKVPGVSLPCMIHQCHSNLLQETFPSSHAFSFSVQLFNLTSFLFCTLFCMFVLASWVVFQCTLWRHVGKWLTEVASNGPAVMLCTRMGGYHLSVAPNLKHQGQNDFNPTLEDTLEHLKVSLKCSPWRPTMALVIPCS